MKTFEITVLGLVQGIGYRPFVAEQAEALGIVGQVKNEGGIVRILASGNEEALTNFVERLNAFYPDGARVDRVEVKEVGQEEPIAQAFAIVESKAGEDRLRFLPADLPTCPRCEEERKDPKNRRYRYPFISCVSCGPRYSILDTVPYDRESITMADFAMCPDCEKEYKEKGNVRRHAQTIACPNCGPKLRLVPAAGLEPASGSVVAQEAVKNCTSEAETEATLQAAIALLQQGKIGAIRDIGGYHFAFDPHNAESARRLRAFKNREEKPFAVMFKDLTSIREYCKIDEREEALLLSSPRPIVLLEKKEGGLCFVEEVGMGSDRIGAMLPCNPLQSLLVEAVGPLVMTSGNRGGEPIITEEAQMESLLSEGIDFMLTHDRRILTPLEDSIYQVNGAYVQILRRGRGLVPEPVVMGRSLSSPAFAAGGDLKAVFALGKQNMAYLSSHFGDLDDYRAALAREKSVAHMKRLLQIEPMVTVGDLHPRYISSEAVKRRVQHHEAHVLSVMAEHGLVNALGVAFDGTGYGTDGSIWGGEFLTVQGKTRSRVACLSPVAMAGSDLGAKDGRMSLAAYVLAAKTRGLMEPQGITQKCLDAEQVRMLSAMEEAGIGVVKSSSMGRLFDAVATMLGVKNYNTYEGACAIALEQLARKSECPYIIPFSIYEEDGILQADSVKYIVDLWNAYEGGILVEDLALGFHLALADMVTDMVEALAWEGPVVLSGGTFCNRILLTATTKKLKEKKKQVYINEQVPCGDGGLALGQLYAMTLEDE